MRYYKNNVLLWEMTKVLVLKGHEKDHGPQILNMGVFNYWRFCNALVQSSRTIV